MSIKETELEVTWMNSTRKRYESLGYTFTNYNEKFMVKIDDVPKYSELNITAICDKCHKEKIMTLHAYHSIIKKHDNYYRCRECYNEEKSLKYDIIKQEVIQSNYQLLTSKDEYKNGYTRIKYLCSKHGAQEMRASNFHNGKRCPKCAQDARHDKYAFTPEEVSDKISKLGGVLLNENDYINQDINNLNILCPRCKKNIFTTSLKHFKQHGGQSCPDCYKKESVGERKIRQWLEDNNFKYVSQKWFRDCRDINPLPFDFYLPDENIIIEFDGEQHFKEKHFFSNNHLKSTTESITSYIQKHDYIKNEYCIHNNINLIRIPYTQINNIELILQNKLIA